MSIDAKVTFLSRVENEIGKILTVDETNIIISLMTHEMDSFVVEHGNCKSVEKDECLNAYLEAKKIEGRSPRTIERYDRLLKIVMKAVKVPTREVTIFHLRKFLSDEKARGIQDSTLEGLRQAICAYFNWLQKEGLIEKNPASNLGAIKYQKKIRKAFSTTDIEKLKLCCKNERDRAIVLFLNATGCRISEVVNLNRDDVDLINLKCKVLGKGNKERTVYFDQVTAMALDNYLSKRRDDYPSLFLNKRKTRLLQGGIRFLLKTLGNKAQVENVHPHKFRRTLATNLTSKGMPIQEVATILGHDKLDTTMKYVCINSAQTQRSYMHYI